MSESTIAEGCARSQIADSELSAQIEEAVRDFARRLAESQITLDAETARVLRADLWSLYE